MDRQHPVLDYVTPPKGWTRLNYADAILPIVIVAGVALLFICLLLFWLSNAPQD